MVVKMKLTFNETISILGTKNLKRTEDSSTLPPDVHEIVAFYETWRNILPSKILFDSPTEDILLRTNLSTFTTKNEEHDEDHFSIRFRDFRDKIGAGTSESGNFFLLV